MQQDDRRAIEAAQKPTVETRFKTPVPEGASMAQRAYFELRDRIVSLRIPPGAFISEEQVMRDLGMSRTPIREALLRLSQEKLVTIIPRRGTLATEVHVGDVGIIYEFRRELEVTAAGWAALRRTEADINRIEETRELLVDSAAHASTLRVDARSQLAIDQRVHELVYRLCGNRLLQGALSNNYFLAARIWFLVSGRILMDEPYKHQTEMLDAIKLGDVEASRRYAREHSEYAESVLRAAL